MHIFVHVRTSFVDVLLSDAFASVLVAIACKHSQGGILQYFFLKKAACILNVRDITVRMQHGIYTNDK